MAVSSQQRHSLQGPRSESGVQVCEVFTVSQRRRLAGAPIDGRSAA